MGAKRKYTIRTKDQKKSIVTAYGKAVKTMPSTKAAKKLGVSLKQIYKWRQELKDTTPIRTTGTKVQQIVRRRKGSPDVKLVAFLGSPDHVVEAIKAFQ